MKHSGLEFKENVGQFDTLPRGVSPVVTVRAEGCVDW